MAKLTSTTDRAQIQLTLDDNAAANTGAQGEQNKIPDFPAGPITVFA
jgi:hypothetical protein